MVESYQKDDKYFQFTANKKAKQLAKEVNGKDNWNQGNWPTNIDYIVGADEINGNYDLFKILKENGPVYAYYCNEDVAHMVVVTGVDMINDIVYSNNPWGVKGEQSYDEFLNGVAHESGQDDLGMKFGAIYIPTQN